MAETLSASCECKINMGTLQLVSLQLLYEWLFMYNHSCKLGKDGVPVDARSQKNHKVRHHSLVCSTSRRC